MNTSRIIRLRKVGNFRAFQSWSDGGVPEPFQRVNLIYGTNGSGKSTLASLFQACASQSPPAGLGLQLDVETAGNISLVTEATPDFWDRVRVFNRIYVEANLRFDDEGGPNPSSLLTLGGSNLANEEELAGKRDRQAKVRSQLAVARAEHAATGKQIEARLSAVAKTIAEELQPSRISRYRGTNVYTKTQVRSRLDGARTLLASASTDVPSDIAAATSPRMSPVTLGPKPTTLGAGAGTATRELLEREVLVDVLEELRGHGDRAAWVQAGLPVHTNLDTCLFCGQPLTVERRRALASHFDDALQRLQSEIDSQVKVLKDSVDASQQYLRSLPATREFYAEFTERVAQARLDFETEHNAYAAAVAKVVSQLQSKRDNPFQGLPADADLELSPASTEAIEELVVDQRRRSEAHAVEAEAAATRVELGRVAAYAQEYDRALEDQRETSAEIQLLEVELRELDARITSLENVGADPVPKAEELTENVARLLGRSELRFLSMPDGPHYSIERDGRPARHLSEGERTAIALLYFLASVRRDAVAGEGTILVIDDPVSSLDNEILFGASSFLWTGLVPASHICQFFLLTHNFELFRQWVVQLERTKKVEVPGGHTVHELRMRYERSDAEVVRRCPRLEPWTRDTKLSGRLRSQYHFWFARVAQTLVLASPDLCLAERMDLLALAPNAARRMMEGFLSFRYPEHIGNFHAGMGAALATVENAALRCRVERYLHAYSHNEEGDISAMLDPSEATCVFRGLFEMMQILDHAHLSGMCTALGIDETQLLTAGPLPATP